ncbi:MAG: class I SAM-dependent RNA methyltransferase [Candidatus Sulfotelmatobacter sp.]
MILSVEKMVYGGDGLARLPADADRSGVPSHGKAVFIPFVLAGEKVEASLTETKPGFARARADKIITASPHRVPPACPYFLRCGGCHYQQASYEHQVEIKKEILRENLRRIAKLELTCEIQAHLSPAWNYRNRSRLQVRIRPEFAAGYFKFASHELLAVEECPISSPLINQAVATLWQAGRAGSVPDGIREVEFFANADDSKLLVEASCAPEVRRGAIRSWMEECFAMMPQIAGAVAFREKPSGEWAPLISMGTPELIYQTSRSSFRVSSGSFFQTNRFLADELVEIVTAGRSGEVALDLYAGVGLFSTALACNFRHVVSVESSQTSANDLAYNLPSNGEAVRSPAEQYLEAVSGASRGGAGHSPVAPRGEMETGRVGKGKFPQNYLHTPDLIVVDPPRGGLGDRVARSLATWSAPRVTYVSCDPATLARDLMPLLAAGYGAAEVHLVDLFPQTFHLESVVQLMK